MGQGDAGWGGLRLSFSGVDGAGRGPDDASAAADEDDAEDEGWAGLLLSDTCTVRSVRAAFRTPSENAAVVRRVTEVRSSEMGIISFATPVNW